MALGEIIQGFEQAGSLEKLQTLMQSAIENFGFTAYNFFDAGRAHLEVPLYFGTTGDAWENEYRSNAFANHDPMLSAARRSNVGFRWTEIPLPLANGKRKPVALHLMEAAKDHGFQDGFIQPYHFVDAQGRNYSALSALFWKDDKARLDFLFSTEKRYELQVVLLYWTQRVVSLMSETYRSRAIFAEVPHEFQSLTDREREVLEWAARGRTVAETAELLNIKAETAKTHIVNAIEKLGSTNKTNAVAKAFKLGLIDI